MDLFPSLGEGVKTSTLLGPLERTNLSHWKRANGEGVLPPHLRTEPDPVSETLCFLVSRIPDDGQSTVILSVIHHRQNPLKAT
jgi:hypothetical protein